MSRIRIFKFLIISVILASLNFGESFAQSKIVEASEQFDTEKVNAMLDSIWNTEQEPIRRRDSIGRVHGFESLQFNKQNEIYHRNHDINEKKIIKLLDTSGWPNRSLVGEEGHLTICNVLQHSSIEIRKKYLPMMHKAVRQKDLAPRLLARAEDRLATDRGELQVYGGQIKYYPETKSFDVWPIADPENVDERRAEIGLVPMNVFLSNLRNPLKWDLEVQIKRTEDFVRASKNTSSN